MQEKFEALVLNDIPLPTDVRVNTTITNHPEQLTKKELDDITTVFRSLETGLREATIYPKVSFVLVCQAVYLKFVVVVTVDYKLWMHLFQTPFQ